MKVGYLFIIAQQRARAPLQVVISLRGSFVSSIT
jgi:hypothetical protein